MYKLCKTEQSSIRQREIENCLVEILRHKHYDDVTVTEICRKINMPRKSFYRYFDGKEDIIHSIVNHLLMEYNLLQINTNNIGDITLRGEFEIFFGFWKGKKDILSVLDRSGLLGYLIEKATDYAMAEFNNIKGYISESNDEESLVVYKFIVSGIMTLMIDWYKDGFKESVENMSRATVKIITRPLFENLSRTE